LFDGDCDDQPYSHKSCNYLWTPNTFINGNPFGECTFITSPDIEVITSTRNTTNLDDPVELTALSCNQLMLSFTSINEEVIPIKILTNELEEILELEYTSIVGENMVVFKIDNYPILESAEYLIIKTVLDGKNIYKDFIINCSEKKINIYPNPIHDLLNIEVESSIAEELNVEIYNALGNLVKQFSFKVNSGKNIHQENFLDFPKGLYFIKIIYENNKSTTKRIIRS